MPPARSIRPFWWRRRARHRPFWGAWMCSGRRVCHRASIPIAAAITSSRRRRVGRSTRGGSPRWGGRSIGWGSSTSRPTRRRRGAGRRGGLGTPRGGSERMFGTPQGGLPKDFVLAGIDEIEAANRFLRDVYLPRHNARFAKPPAIEQSAFVTLADPASLAEILCIEEERIVARDNTVAYEKLRLQLPESRVRAHYVKARVKVHEYPDGTLAVFHGPRLLARYDAAGQGLNDEDEGRRVIRFDAATFRPRGFVDNASALPTSPTRPTT